MKLKLRISVGRDVSKSSCNYLASHCYTCMKLDSINVVGPPRAC